MSRIALGFMLSIFTMGACAQATTSVDAQSDPVVVDERVEVVVDRNAAAKNDFHCVQETGSRIKPREKGECLAVNGVSYSNDDLERTGGKDTGEALENLDPSISTR